MIEYDEISNKKNERECLNKFSFGYQSLSFLHLANPDFKLQKKSFLKILCNEFQSKTYDFQIVWSVKSRGEKLEN